MIDGVFPRLPFSAEAAVPGSFGRTGTAGALFNGTSFKRCRVALPEEETAGVWRLTGGKAGD